MAIYQIKDRLTGQCRLNANGTGEVFDYPEDALRQAASLISEARAEYRAADLEVISPQVSGPLYRLWTDG